MATKKKDTPALIDGVIDLVKAEGFGVFAAWQKRLLPKKPVPFAAARLAKLKVAKQPAPPSLVRWLSFHATFQGSDFNETDWYGQPIPELLDEAIGPMARFLFEDENPPIDRPAVKLDTFSDYEVHAILAGTPDDAGELPIVNVYANQPGHSHIELYQPGFDAYVASWLRPEYARKLGVDLESAAFTKRIKHHVATNLGGKRRYKLGR